VADGQQGPRIRGLLDAASCRLWQDGPQSTLGRGIVNDGSGGLETQSQAAADLKAADNEPATEPRYVSVDVDALRFAWMS
jgi:hypothetical protein